MSLRGFGRGTLLLVRFYLCTIMCRKKEKMLHINCCRQPTEKNLFLQNPGLHSMTWTTLFIKLINLTGNPIIPLKVEFYWIFQSVMWNCRKYKSKDQYTWKFYDFGEVCMCAPLSTKATKICILCCLWNIYKSAERWNKAWCSDVVLCAKEA